MAHLDVKARLAPTAHEVADTTETNKAHRHFVDRVTSQEGVRECYRMQYLPKDDKADAVVEGLAWLVVLGLLFTTIWLTGTL